MQTLYPLPATNPALSSGQPGPWQGGFQDGEFSPGSSILPSNTLRCRQMPLQDPSQAKLAAQAGPSETSLVCMMVNKDPAAASVLETTAGSLTSLLQLQHSPRGFPRSSCSSFRFRAPGVAPTLSLTPQSIPRTRLSRSTHLSQTDPQSGTRVRWVGVALVLLSGLELGCAVQAGFLVDDVRI